MSIRGTCTVENKNGTKIAKKLDIHSINVDIVKRAIERECQKERYTINAMKQTKTPSAVTFRIMLDKSKPTKNGNRYRE